MDCLFIYIYILIYQEHEQTCFLNNVYCTVYILYIVYVENGRCGLCNCLPRNNDIFYIT